ncbi:hypothetical protein [Curtobacterium poinsettiae]|uniref:hypothetical protein n=1 Tax=Curtobacterium poinsettiae TaxID=159612 RepID=UPI0021C9B3CC|nr:hypothetical protein [Curtobacterium flaccumfaciens]MCU0114796.1 hypothetical protein [Curtobacterium flaccumfaciens]
MPVVVRVRSAQRTTGRDAVDGDAGAVLGDDEQIGHPAPELRDAERVVVVPDSANRGVLPYAEKAAVVSRSYAGPQQECSHPPTTTTTSSRMP